MTKGIENLAESFEKEKINAFFEQYKKEMRSLRNFSERRGADNLCLFKMWKEVSSAFGMRVVSMTDEEFQPFQEWKKSRESEKTGYTLNACFKISCALPVDNVSHVRS